MNRPNAIWRESSRTAVDTSFSIFNVRSDEIVEEEERLGIHGDEYVVVELGHETAFHQRFFGWKEMKTTIYK